MSGSLAAFGNCPHDQGLTSAAIASAEHTLGISLVSGKNKGKIGQMLVPVESIFNFF